MKLHLPLFLRKSVLSCLALVAGCTLSSGSLAFADVLVLGAGDELSIDYAAADSIPNLENGSLQLTGDTLLQLLNCGSGDGKTYTLVTGISGLLDAQGNAISLDDTNNAASLYFDASQPGAGFWADATLQLSADGTLTLVRHNEIVKDALDVTTPQTGSVDYSYYKGISFKDLSSSLSSSVARGGAIYGRNDSTIMLSNNGSVEFRGNTASSSGSSSGGAIYGAWRCTITLSNNGSVEFRGNTASSSGSSSGGAIWGYTITLSNNGSVSFSGNTASSSSSDYYARGGAICGDSGSIITLSDNGSVTFSGNTASASSDDASGGAIRAYGDLSIRNNDSVSFYQNAEVKNGSYRLRSIYAEGSGDVISLSAAAGKSITFYDSVYIGSGAMVNLNQDYTYQEEDGISFSIKQQGDIIFTGKYAETHLNEILAADEQGRTATTEEILLSRTTEVNALTNLHGGRLRVEDGAIYRGQGITVHEGSNATVRVKDATLNHTGYELHFFEGTTLATLGESEIFGDVIVESTATAAFSALTRLEGNLTLASGSELSLDGALTLNGTLTLGLGLTLSGDILADIKNLAAGQSITLVSGLESLTVQMQTLMRSLEYTTVMTGQELVAADYFSNLQTDSGYVLIYNGATGALMVTQSIPEPTTATLSLLALAALAVRRRRK